MEQPAASELQERLACLERQLRTMRILSALGLLALVACAYSMLRAGPILADGSANVLRIRGLIIEDEQGHERILLGAPVPRVSGRKRSDDVTGMILLGESGADRIAIASPSPAPQILGKLVRRAPGTDAGIILNDPDGNERGGFSVFDNGRVVLGMDYQDREAVSLVVMPQEGFAGLIVNAESGSRSERAEIGVLKDGTSLLKLADTAGTERVMLIVREQSPAKFLGINPGANGMLDVGVLRLNPFVTKQLVVKADGQAIRNALDAVRP